MSDPVGRGFDRSLTIDGGGGVDRAVVMGRIGEVKEKESEVLRVASRGADLEVEEEADSADAGPLGCWLPGGLAVARSDCGTDEALVWDGGRTGSRGCGGVDGRVSVTPSAFIGRDRFRQRGC